MSVVVPCYNEEAGVDELYRRIKSVCEVSVGVDYEIVLVNDGSKDMTWQKIKYYAESDEHMVCINLSRNHGHQLALSAGLQYAKGDRVLVLDADLQDPPELLNNMMEIMDGGVDVVYGKRLRRDGETGFKILSAFVFYRILDYLVDVKIPIDTGDFRLMNRKALDIINSMPEHYRFIRGMVGWIGLKQEPILYERSPRFAGNTKYPISKMIRFAIDAITGFSVRPLRIATYSGIIYSVFSMILLLYIIVNYFIGKSVEGWTSLGVIILATGGIQMIVIGIIGEYLGRLYVESKRRPLYIIDEVIRGDVNK